MVRKKFYKLYDAEGRYWKKLKMTKSEAAHMQSHIRKNLPKLKLVG